MNLFVLIAVIIPLSAALSRIKVPIEGAPAENRGPCNDGLFMVISGPVGSQNAAKLCPTGYRLADVSNILAFRRAIEVLFNCKGPSSEAWVGVVQLNGAKVNMAVTVTAPDAIEKGGVGIVEAKVDLAKANAMLPAICERILLGGDV